MAVALCMECGVGERLQGTGGRCSACWEKFAPGRFGESPPDGPKSCLGCGMTIISGSPYFEEGFCVPCWDQQDVKSGVPVGRAPRLNRPRFGGAWNAPNFGFCLNCGKQYERNPLVEAKRLCPGCYKNEANNTITTTAPLCVACKLLPQLDSSGLCTPCFMERANQAKKYRQEMAEKSRAAKSAQDKTGALRPAVFSAFGSCSICKVQFTRASAKVEIDRTEYCFPCWDELKRTGRVDLTRRPVAPELFPQPNNMPPLVEMRPKRQIQLED